MSRLFENGCKYRAKALPKTTATRSNVCQEVSALSMVCKTGVGNQSMFSSLLPRYGMIVKGIIETNIHTWRHEPKEKLQKKKSCFHFHFANDRIAFSDVSISMSIPTNRCFSMLCKGHRSNHASFALILHREMDFCLCFTLSLIIPAKCRFCVCRHHFQRGGHPSIEQTHIHRQIASQQHEKHHGTSIKAKPRAQFLGQ